ncbi:MAG: hypothetical protein Q4B26_10900 [Eubacteriales bacterium]|nr:hypothetical protein [Eubacteriales bacterium]
MKNRKSARRFSRGRQLLGLLLSVFLICSPLMSIFATASEAESEAVVTESVQETDTEAFTGESSGEAAEQEVVNPDSTSEDGEAADSTDADNQESENTDDEDSEVTDPEDTDPEVTDPAAEDGETDKPDEAPEEGGDTNAEEQPVSGFPAEETTYQASCSTANVQAAVAPGSFNEEVTLRMSELPEGSAAYQQAENALNSVSEFDEMRAFDISFVNAAGIELEPSLPVSVQIQANLEIEEEVAGGQVQVTHIEEEAQIVATASVNGDACSTEFIVESFSTFTLSWNRSQQNKLNIICIDEQGNEIGTSQSGNINTETQVSQIAPKINWYNFSKAVIASNAQEAASGGIEASRLRYYGGRWQYRNGNSWQNLTSNNIYFVYSPIVVTVEVYVAGSDLNRVRFSQDMLNLLNVSKLDNWGYFEAGTVQIDLSKVSGDKNSKLLNDSDWSYVKSQLLNLNTSASGSDKNNLIKNYIGQILMDYGAGQNNMYSGLWVSQGVRLAGATRVNSDGTPATNGGYTWHLDLRFQTVHINYIYGNNGITGNVAKDGTSAGSKVFIQGVTMDYTPEIQAPAGYKIVGYFTDPDCSDGNEWNAVGQPINEDTNVYIKIVPQNNAIINYQVQEGQGTVTDPGRNNTPVQHGMEHFNPVTGTVIGSTAEAAEEWVFEGWYSDEALTNKVSGNANYVPAAPSGGWKEGMEVTYYAKFTRVTMPVTVKKLVTGNMGDRTKEFSFTLTKEDGSSLADFSLSHEGTNTIEKLLIGSTIYLKENNGSGYQTTVTYGGKEIQVSGGVYAITLEENTDQIVVTNHKHAVPETGIPMESAPYVLLLIFVFAGMALWTVCRRRNLQ